MKLQTFERRVGLTYKYVEAYTIVKSFLTKSKYKRGYTINLLRCVYREDQWVYTWYGDEVIRILSLAGFRLDIDYNIVNNLKMTRLSRHHVKLTKIGQRKLITN